MELTKKKKKEKKSLAPTSSTQQKLECSAVFYSCTLCMSKENYTVIYNITCGFM